MPLKDDEIDGMVKVAVGLGRDQTGRALETPKLWIRPSNAGPWIPLGLFTEWEDAQNAAHRLRTFLRENLKR